MLIVQRRSRSVPFPSSGDDSNKCCRDITMKEEEEDFIRFKKDEEEDEKDF